MCICGKSVRTRFGLCVRLAPDDSVMNAVSLRAQKTAQLGPWETNSAGTLHVQRRLLVQQPKRPKDCRNPGLCSLPTSSSNVRYLFLQSVAFERSDKFVSGEVQDPWRNHSWQRL